MKIEGGYLIGRIRLLRDRRLNRLLQENNFTEFSGEQGKIVYCLWKEEGINSSELSKRTGLAKNTLTNMLDNLEKQGLIYRVEAKNDKRKKMVYLTDKAKKLEKKTEKINNKMTEIFYKGFSKEEIENFEVMLSKIVDNLEEES